MSTLRIIITSHGVVDPKQRLRAHIDQLPLAKQREFVATALKLIALRTTTHHGTSTAGYRDARHKIKQ
jgi:hypothetical protein